MNKFLIKIDRLSAWILFIGFLLFFITGYGMTKGFINAFWAVNIHNQILPPIVLIAFSIHSSYAISSALKRWKMWNIGSKIFISLFFVVFLSFFMYINYFYKIPKTTTTTNQNPSANQQNSENENNSQNSTDASNTSSQKTFTLTELAKYNGQNGQPAYVAVSGTVYDVSTEFINGSHYSHLAGQDLTDQFNLYHNSSAITKYPIVGILK